MTDELTAARRPCASCPYRRDVPSGVWAPEEYSRLPNYDLPTWAQPWSLFLCHQVGAEDPSARLCAGWVGCHGSQLLALRLGLIHGRVDPAVFRYKTGVPLFESGRAAAAHGLAEIEAPSPKAVATVAKIVKKRRLEIEEL